MEDKDKLSEGEALYNLSQSDEWKIFEQRYNDVLAALSDIRNIPFEVNDGKQRTVLSAEDRTYEMQVRERTLMYLQNIWENMSGTIEEYKELVEGLKTKKVDDGFIIKFDN